MGNIAVRLQQSIVSGLTFPPAVDGFLDECSM
jgi:hypothetical protein